MNNIDSLLEGGDIYTYEKVFFTSVDKKTE